RWGGVAATPIHEEPLVELPGMLHASIPNPPHRQQQSKPVFARAFDVSSEMIAMIERYFAAPSSARDSCPTRGLVHARKHLEPLFVLACEHVSCVVAIPSKLQQPLIR